MVGGGAIMIAHAAGDDFIRRRTPTKCTSNSRPTEECNPPATGSRHPLDPRRFEQPPPGSAHGSVSSSSDKEDLAEAREDYENASDASDGEEAREEYEEQYEDTYGSD
ncbi:MAG: hypothetical protein Q9210_000597 [Variospora velana]